MAKSPDAFRTISEVADWLGVQAHVLRFWESKFSQVKPIKRAGGRRYYRPSDMLLLGGLKQLLHEDGLTIKGAQKLLREKGVAHVADMSAPLDDLTMAVIEGDAEDVTDEVIETAAVEAVTSAEIDADQALPREADAASSIPEPAQDSIPEPEVSSEEPAELSRVPDPEFADPQEIDDGAPTEGNNLEGFEAVASVTPEVPEIEDEPAIEETPDVQTAMPSFRAKARADASEADTDSAIEPAPQDTSAETTSDAPVEETEEPFAVSPPEPDTGPAPKPRNIDVGPMPELADFTAQPSALSAVSALTGLTGAQADEIRPLLARLTRLRASMASPRKDARKD